jgi:D-3-phosphoglycerate dehydrogenase
MLAEHQMRRSSKFKRRAFMGDDLPGRKIGILGLGNAGASVAELCRSLFQMRVLAYDPYRTAQQTASRGAGKLEALDDLLKQAGYISINCPHTAETRGMIGAREFPLMQDHAYCITTARGGIHDEAAPAAALTEGQIAGARLDVWKDEPPSSGHALLWFDNVLVSSHIAGTIWQSR